VLLENEIRSNARPSTLPLSLQPSTQGRPNWLQKNPEATSLATLLRQWWLGADVTSSRRESSYVIRANLSSTSSWLDHTGLKEGVDNPPTRLLSFWKDFRAKCCHARLITNLLYGGPHILLRQSHLTVTSGQREITAAPTNIPSKRSVAWQRQVTLHRNVATSLICVAGKSS
jgi:hypothetical protein